MLVKYEDFNSSPFWALEVQELSQSNEIICVGFYDEPDFV